MAENNSPAKFQQVSSATISPTPQLNQPPLNEITHLLTLQAQNQHKIMAEQAQQQQLLFHLLSKLPSMESIPQQTPTPVTVQNSLLSIDLAKNGVHPTVLESNGATSITQENSDSILQAQAVDKGENEFAIIPISNLPLEESSVEKQAKKAYSNVLDAGLRKVLQQQIATINNVILVDEEVQKKCGDIFPSVAGHCTFNGAPVVSSSTVPVVGLQEVEDDLIAEPHNLFPTRQSNGLVTVSNSEADWIGRFPNATVTASQATGTVSNATVPIFQAEKVPVNRFDW